jgi:hypothetical protein
MGWLESVGLAITSISVHDQTEIGAAVGVGGSIRSAVSTIASTVYVTILNNRLQHTIPAEVPGKLIAAGLPSTSVASFLSAVTVGTPAAFAKVVGLTDSIEAVGIAAYKVASSQGYQTVFYATLTFSGLGIISSFFTPNVDELMTGRVTATFHKTKDEEDFPEK